MPAAPVRWARRLSRQLLRQLLRQSLAGLPAPLRHAVYRRMVDADPNPDSRLVFKIAETEEELDACFRLLHEAYVGEGYMKPDPSGLRVTIYHALPTTTTLCAKWDGEVVGTVSLVREGVFGFPLQSIFDLSDIRAREGRIAEVSSLAVAKAFRRTGGAILFPLLKFMYEYTSGLFDTRHLVIAVHPTRIDLYESLLMFERLRMSEVSEYDFANGAPAVGATLDLLAAPDLFRRTYRGRPLRRNLYRYFTESRLPNIQLPARRLNVTNDPVMTPELLDTFFNRRTQVFSQMDARKRSLLHEIYDRPAFKAVLPALEPQAGTPSGVAGALPGHRLRRHQRYSIKCGAVIRPPADAASVLPAGVATGTAAVTSASASTSASAAAATTVAACPATVIELSLHGFQARCDGALPLGAECEVVVELGKGLESVGRARVMREVPSASGRFYGFLLENPDRLWRQCVQALQQGLTGADLARSPGLWAGAA